ncbi:putative reverse transcriptase domain, reverse transcriptase zinc-binding domain protein [Tanacetum coccineum]
MHNYHLDRGPPRCAFKVDIQKAYDTVDWGFLKATLMGFGFHPRLIHWIMECVSTTSFSLSINGAIHGYFKGKRGLRQGDPMSPYLFALIMEVLALILRRRVRESDSFCYHRYCDKLDIINLCFADDLFLFAHGDANVIMGALDEFKLVSGLTPSLPKSTAYFCNVLNHTKLSILHILPFEEGRLPVKYLGVPLISSRLIYRDCKELIERVQNRLKDWKNKFLSVAGRLQLIKSVIGSMHGKAKVAWEAICLPKHEGGLGIRKLDTFNKALMTSHIWRLISLKESLWVRWIHAYKLKDRNFWEIPIRGNMTWGWRQILRLRTTIRQYIGYQIGDGSKVSVWFDRWCHSSPLMSIISPHDIHRAGFNMSSKIQDVIHDNQWMWPHDWDLKYPTLTHITVFDFPS